MALPSSRESKAHQLGRTIACGVRVLQRFEEKLLISSLWLGTPLRYRSSALWVLKLLFVLVIAAFAVGVAIGFLLLLGLAALPLDARDNEPTIDDVSHPRHQVRYPELYDDFGSLR